MLRKASQAVAALALLRSAYVTFAAPPPPTQPFHEPLSSHPPPACPPVHVRQHKTLVFDTTHLPGGPYYVNDHTLIFGDDGRWHLYGIFHREPYAGEHEVAFVHATSDVRDPAEWGARSFHLSPVNGGIALAYRPDLGETHLWAPHVVRAGGRYVMVFQSGGRDDRAQIRMAESTDLERWARIGDAPLFEDICVARDPMLRKDGELWTLYYTRCGDPGASRSGVAYRTSTDLRRWSAPAMALELESTPPMFNAGYAESPFVFEASGWYYLTVTAYPVAWDATNVYCSRSPVAFGEPPVARLDAHAAEWISSGSGHLFMTHAGAGQGGVWVTPMESMDMDQPSPPAE